MTDSLYKGTGGHNYIQEEDMETSFIESQQRKANIFLREEYGTLPLIEKDLNTLTAQIIKNTCEEIKKRVSNEDFITESEIRDEHGGTGKEAAWIILSKVEDIINNITHPTQ